MRLSTLILLFSVVAVSAADAQRRGSRPSMYGALGDPNEFYSHPDFHGNVKYDGRFVFARIKYRGFEHLTNQGPGWSHDYPRAESHFMRIMRAITTMRPFVEQGSIQGGNLLALDDPELFKYPVAYLSEPGGWHPNDAEAVALRSYLAKGGFLIVDDFEDLNDGFSDMRNFTSQMAKVMPTAKLLEIPRTHAIFDSFFKVNLEVLGRGRRSSAIWYGVFQDNDPRKRLMIVANYLNDIGEAWEWSDRGFNVVPTNEAYKLGVNYIIYALTH
jgi:hypothetical protein